MSFPFKIIFIKKGPSPGLEIGIFCNGSDIVKMSVFARRRRLRQGRESVQIFTCTSKTDDQKTILMRLI